MKILVVVDMQNDFIYGDLGTSEARSIVPKVVEKITKYSADSDIKILFTRDSHDATDYLSTQEGINLPVLHCVMGTEGWEIIPELKDFCENTVEKATFGCRNLASTISRLAREANDNHIDEVEFIGVCTDICVISNALLLKAFEPELVISCDSSCCAGVTPAKHEAALEVLRSCQIDVK